MTFGDHKLRIALAVFESARTLEPTITALLDEGVPMARIGLIVSAATAGTLAADVSQRTGAPATQSLSGLVAALVALSASPDGQAIVATPSVIGPWRSGWRFPAIWGQDVASDAAPRLAPDLERQVSAGAAILTVESPSLREQWLCTRILLAHSTSTVLALECSLPQTPP